MSVYWNLMPKLSIHGAMFSLPHALSRHDAEAQRKVRLFHLYEGFNRREYGKVQSSVGNPVANGLVKPLGKF